MPAVQQSGLLRRRPATRWIGLAALVAVLLLSWGWRAAGGELKPKLKPDTESYLKAPLGEGPVRLLSHYRTPGYPLFLQYGRQLGEGFSAIPRLQALIFCLAVIALYLAVHAYTESAVLALLAALPLPFAPITAYTASLLTESLAASLTLLAAAMAIWLGLARRSRLAWPAAGLALVVFGAYQVRPTAQWLVLWAPLATAILAAHSRRDAAGLRRRWLLPAGLALLATLVPWLAYSSMRQSQVGHFGVVSFAGTNLAAVSTFIASQDSVRDLPDDVRPTGQLIVKRRLESGWPRIKAGDDARAWFHRYNQSLWKVAYRSANWHMHREQRRKSGSPIELWRRSFPVERDRRLGAFAVEVIKNHPGAYLSWVTGGVRYGVSGALRMPSVLLGLAAVMLTLVWRALTPSRRPIGRAPVILAMIWMAHSLGALLLVSLLSFPMHRYLVAIVLLLPSALLLLAAALVPTTRTAATP